MSDLSQVSALVESKDASESIEVLQDMSVGQRLSISRQEKAWSVQYVADQLKLSQGQILALESNKFDALPKLVIVRGFVRAYAKLLKIDADSLIALLPKESVPTHLETSLRPALSTPFVDSRLSLLGHHDTNRRYIIGAVVLVLLVVVFLVAQRTEIGKNLIEMLHLPGKGQVATDELKAMNTVPTQISGVNDAVVSVPKLEKTAASMASLQSVDSTGATASSINPNEGSLGQAEPLSNSNVAPPAVNLPSAADVASASIAQAAPKLTTSVAEVVVNGLPDSDVVVFKFRENSWIQVKTEGGTILTAHLAKAGTEESFSVKQSLFVRIGNAAGVDAKLRGRPLAVSSERGSNVANLVVK